MELRQGKESGPPPFAPLAKTLKTYIHVSKLHVHVHVHCRSVFPPKSGTMAFPHPLAVILKCILKNIVLQRCMIEH